jgi:hypothetical protein
MAITVRCSVCGAHISNNGEIEDEASTMQILHYLNQHKREYAKLYNIIQFEPTPVHRLTMQPIDFGK